MASPEEERPVDRIGAAGRAAIDCPIGILVWKARDSLETAAYLSLQKELFRRFTKRYRDDETIARAIVSQALHEFFSSDCRNCQGTKEVLYQECKVTCPECQGSGTHRYSDSERARTMQLSYARVKYSAHKLAWLTNLLGTEDRRFSLLMSAQLDRGRA